MPPKKPVPTIDPAAKKPSKKKPAAAAKPAWQGVADKMLKPGGAC
jgi:hypothetical protein